MFILFVRGMSELLSITSSLAPLGAYKTLYRLESVPEFDCSMSDNPVKQPPIGAQFADLPHLKVENPVGRMALGLAALLLSPVLSMLGLG
jgi:hypothetical protein